MLSNLVEAPAIVTILNAYVSYASKYVGDQEYSPGMIQDVRSVNIFDGKEWSAVLISFELKWYFVSIDVRRSVLSE